MKMLGLFRHAKSDWSGAARRDYDRGLNDRGRRGAALMGAHIRGYDAPWEAVIASPAERVRRTLEAADLALPIRWEPRAYLADPAVLFEILRELPGGTGAVLIAGHNPGLQELILGLAGARSDGKLLNAVADKYPTATFAVLELEIASWAECAPGRGSLVHVARPRDLDPTLGPAD